MKYSISRVFVLFFVGLGQIAAQGFYFVDTLASMPEPVSNNAVAAISIDDTTYLYSFCGINGTKIWSGIHNKAWRLNVQSGQWQVLPPVPDPNGGKIAAAASVVKGKIYLIGGYHVSANGSEVSSKKIHRFDPVSNQWLSDGPDIPKAIDDQVQVVWRDSLIYVITGWSNTANVANVQVYNPTTNLWAVATPVPNTNVYKAFGAAGVIVGDTIYYAGGAASSPGFPAIVQFRKGWINPQNPLEIVWSVSADPMAKGYRMAAANLDDRAVWIGGSDITYNYDGIAYNGTGGVPALSRVKTYDPTQGDLVEITFDPAIFPAVMDLRGGAQVDNAAVFTAGGMGQNQQVTDGVYRFTSTTASASAPADDAWKFYPNPACEVLNIDPEFDGYIALYDTRGQLLKPFQKINMLDLKDVFSGVYILIFYDNHSVKLTKLIVDCH